MGTFKRAQKFSKTSKDLDQKIQSLNEEMIKTGMSASKKDVDMSGELFNWRQEFGESQEIKEEVDIIIEEVKEKNKKLASVQHSLVETKLTEANEIFADLYGDQVHGVVETYIGRYASEIKDLREDVIVELQKRPKDLKNLEERLDKLDKGYQVLSERVAKASNAAREQQLNEETGVTVNQLKQHYQTMIGKLQENLAMGSGGGGEVNLKYLDDVVGVATNPSAYDGKFLKYDHSLGKFVFETVSGGAGVGTGGIQLTDLSVIVTPAGISSLTYDDLTGIFEFTPPDLVGFTTTGDVLGIVTSGQIAGVVTAGDLVGFATVGSVTSIEGINILDDDSSIGIVTQINFGDNLFVTTSVQAGILTISGPNPSGIDTAGTSTFENLYVSGISTFIGAADFNGTVDIDGHTELDNLNVSGISTFTGVIDANGDLDVDGHTELDNLNVSGISTFTGVIDANGDLDVDGHTELDNLNVSGVSTFTGDVNTTSLSADQVNISSTATVGILTATTLRGLNTKVYGVLEVDNVSWLDGGAEFGPRTFNKGYASINTLGFATFSGIEVSGVSTFNGLIDANSDLNVDGQIVVGSVGTGVTINGGTGDIFAGNSITAGFFYGDGQFLQNISPEPVVGFDTSGQTFLTNVSISGITTVHGTNEEFATLTSSTGTVNHDCSAGHIFYHTTPSSDFSVNLINLTLSAEHATTISIVINQGATAYTITSLEIAGSPVTIKWQGNNTPSGTSSGIDNFTFSILNDGGTYVVLGQSVSFGGV